MKASILPDTEASMKFNPKSGKIGVILMWLLGVPLPIILIFLLIRGC
jgi:hypothetical protein